MIKGKAVKGKKSRNISSNTMAAPAKNPVRTKLSPLNVSYAINYFIISPSSPTKDLGNFKCNNSPPLVLSA